MSGAVGGCPVPMSGNPAVCRTDATDRQPDRHGSVVAAAFEVEGEQERQEADDASQQPHGFGRMDDAGAAQLDRFCGVGRLGRDGCGREPRRQQCRRGGGQIAAHTSAASGPMNFTTNAAGAPTTRPTMPDSSDRRELALTNSASSPTTVGTSAALAMP